ncbi:MAG: hypothetical protein H6999_02315 [Hahellaceae bacterium]|nr:hypothetical protein [Hahellaceae bacterium]MCP5168576.1 hypothetical protein [Hahellaceae bacterium]
MQQINLYTDDLRPRRDPLPLPLMLGLVVGLCLVLGAITFWKQQQLQTLVAKSALKDSQKATMEVQVTALAEKVGAMRRDESLVALNGRLRERVEIRTELLRTLGGVIAVNPYRFSELMLGFARQKHAQIWLTQFGFGSGGRYLQFAGVALAPEAVPEYLQQLRSEVSFGGRDFQLFSLQEDLNTGTPGLRFNIASGPNVDLMPGSNPMSPAQPSGQ